MVAAISLEARPLQSRTRIVPAVGGRAAARATARSAATTRANLRAVPSSHPQPLRPQTIRPIARPADVAAWSNADDLFAVANATIGVHTVSASSTTQRTDASARQSAWSALHQHRVLVALIMLAVVIAIGLGALGRMGSPAPTAATQPATIAYVVKPGDSLWTVARAVAPHEDPRAVVAQLEGSRNGVPLMPGQTVLWTSAR